MSGEAGEELDTPAARIMARRESRAAMPDRLKVAAPDDSSDEEWNGDDDEDEEEDGRVYLDASKCGRVRLHAVQGPAQSSSGLGVDDERRKSLADKGWARRTAVVNSVGASGAASFELVPGREQFGPGDDAAAEWERQMLQFTEDNFEDVVAWYIERLGEPSYLSREEPKEANWMHIAESGEVIVVSIDSDGDEVVISIGRMRG